MSYRAKSDTISVHYSGSVSYPASQNGGSVSYSGTEYVYINIDVDDDPFNDSVNTCNNHVTGLTTAVVATESAQIASINSNAKKVGKTIVDGFFKTIRSEISQQIMELSTKLDATLMHLRELGKRCVEKQTQMQNDYNRIAERYIKVFDDLNNELENRIFALDEPAFTFRRNSDSHSERSLSSDLSNTVSVFGREGGELQARISASVAKKRALDTIGKANTFLVKQKRLETTINQSMLKESVNAVQYSPICFIETQNEKSQINKNVYQPDCFSKIQANQLVSDFQMQNWSSFNSENANQIGRYFNAEVNQKYSAGDTHTNRVRENIVKMLNFNQIKSV